MTTHPRIITVLLPTVLVSLLGFGGVPFHCEAAEIVPPAGLPDSLLTLFEASGGLRTPRHAETVAYARRLAASFPELSYMTFGTSPQGRELPLLVADPHGRTDPAAVRRDPDRAVLLIQACIHAGESCGKDATLLLLRDLALAGWPEGLLDRLTIVFIPIFNVDGHERFGPFGRINQNGPAEMGWRVTATNLNLNRDYMKADTSEMRDWLALWNAWLPDFFFDIHATDGADYQYPLTWQMELHGNLDAGLTDWSRDLMSSLRDELGEAGMPVGPYIWFRKWRDPTSGLRSWAAGPRYAQGYAAVQNRPGMLLELHMLKPYAVRVEATYLLLERAFRRLAAGAPELRTLNLAADRHAATLAARGDSLPLRFETADEPEPFTYLGVEHELVTGEITGGEYYRYHADRPQTVVVDRYARQEATLSLSPPAAYLVPPEWQEVLARLEAHGVPFARLTEAVETTVRSYRFVEPQWRTRPYEGHLTVEFTAESITETRVFPPGTAVVRTDQRAARVVAHALEPQGPDSFVSWGFFDAVFGPVEYVEPRVIEAMIPGLLEADPELGRRFEAKLEAEPEFAADSQRIRTWFYRQTPYADDRAGIYPVGLLDDLSAVDGLPAR